MKLWGLILLLLLTTGCIDSSPELSNLDAIDLLPYTIDNHETTSWDATIESGCQTSAKGFYLLEGAHVPNIGVLICEASDLNETLKEISPDLDSPDSITESFEKILLDGGIEANYTRLSSHSVSATVLWWTQEDFLFIVSSSDEEGNRDTLSMAKFVANSVLREQDKL